MNIGFTPGPWKVSDIASGFEIETMQGNQVAQTSEIYAARKPSDHDERRANAKLIAVSPELLELLTALERMAGQPHLYDDPIRVKARAAIAKALGQA